MARHPDDQISTLYEWTVEQIDISQGERDIIECWFFDENKRADAERFAASLAADGEVVDFGLSQMRGSIAEGVIDRGYAYRDDDGSWPSEFDNGRAIPKRFALA